jgi:hypothetical protein
MSAPLRATRSKTPVTGARSKTPVTGADPSPQPTPQPPASHSPPTHEHGAPHSDLEVAPTRLPRSPTTDRNISDRTTRSHPQHKGFPRIPP